MKPVSSKDLDAIISGAADARITWAGGLFGLIFTSVAQQAAAFERIPPIHNEALSGKVITLYYGYGESPTPGRGKWRCHVEIPTKSGDAVAIVARVTRRPDFF
jgi:hypothetical protein